MTANYTPLKEEFTLKTIDGYLHLVLPIGHFSWEHFLGQLLIRLETGVYQDSGVILEGREQDITNVQLEAVMTILVKHQLRLHKVLTQNRSTAIVAAGLGLSVEQTNTFQPPNDNVVEPLYLQKIIRSGVVLRHPGTIILRGDVHPGGEIVSGGDIVIWGKLKGKAETTNPKGIIMALEIDPTQLKIGGRLALTESSGNGMPEVAYLDRTEICIVPAREYRIKSL